MKYIRLIILILCFAKVQAQTSLPIPRNIISAYEKGTRSANGMPGKKYWQNRANYKIDVSFNPETLILQGSENIAYFNESPDTLTRIVFKLYPNLYQKGAERMMKIDSSDIGNGVIIDSILSEEINPSNQINDGTSWIIKNITVLPSSQVHFTIQYHYKLNKGSHIRTGEIEPGADFIAYFFPRIAVYDDVDEWNMNPYLGSQEFYNDFCKFDMNVTVPNNYLVWCTGNLTNAKDILQDTYYKRLQEAERSDKITTIIDSNDILKHDITIPKPTHTWHYEADSVTDVAFALSNHYMWQSTSLVVDKKTNRRTRVDAVFNPIHKDFFDVIDFARKTVSDMSFSFPAWPYPYAHETVFDGLDQMEYPMMVNDNPLTDKVATIELTDHEIFHTMFPFYMGINETKYAWMDEGWATIGEWLISPKIDTSIVDDYGVYPYEMAAGTESDLPIIIPSTEQNGNSYFLNSYPKPAFGYLYVKDMLGEDRFTKALHHYIATWHGKHPLPYDFFASLNEGAGENMNWFWKRWFFDNGTPNLAINSVDIRKNKYTVTVVNKGGKPVPVDLTFYFADGSQQTVHASIACWKGGNLSTSLSLSSNKKPTHIKLGSTYTPDTDKSDNDYFLK